LVVVVVCGLVGEALEVDGVAVAAEHVVEEYGGVAFAATYGGNVDEGFVEVEEL
jgi:hypothetical protein